MLHFFTTDVNLIVFLRALMLLLVGFILARLVSRASAKALQKRLTAHQIMVVQRILYYLILIVFLVSAFQQLGFHIGALLGATGILTVAIGIASQTSLSNVISGIFMIGERAFQIGDAVKVNEFQGYVLSIDWLSVKIRTYDNNMVRIPNETLIKSAITNLSYFPIRRADIFIGIAYKEDIETVKKTLFQVAKKNSFCLADPEPQFFVLNFGDFAVNLQFSVWTNKESYNDLKTTIQIDIKEAFEKASIEIPFPSRSLFAGNETKPLPIKIIS